MANDHRVEAALNHWAPRFVANGIPLTDFQEVTDSIEKWEDWCSAWAARGEIHEEMGRNALSQGYNLSAGEHLTTAGVCYHFAKFLFVNDIHQMREAHMKAINCRNLALPHLKPPGERVEIPYQGKLLAGILRKPLNVETPSVVILAMGLDSSKEEMGAYEKLFLDRNLATLTFDGPGQGEGEYEFGIRYDYEVPVGKVIDYIENRNDLDADRIGLWGVSLGGYYVPRAAAYEKRIQACIGLSGPYDWGAVWDSLPILTKEAFRVRSHSTNEEEARLLALKFSLKGVASEITCPIFIVAGKLDRLISYKDAEKLAEEVSGPAELLIIKDGNHVANNRAYRYRLQTADWMAKQLEDI